MIVSLNFYLIVWLQWFRWWTLYKWYSFIRFWQAIHVAGLGIFLLEEIYRFNFVQPFANILTKPHNRWTRQTVTGYNIKNIAPEFFLDTFNFRRSLVRRAYRRFPGVPWSRVCGCLWEERLRCGPADHLCQGEGHLELWQRKIIVQHMTMTYK